MYDDFTKFCEIRFFDSLEPYIIYCLEGVPRFTSP
jgi:hypothetical protein